MTKLVVILTALVTASVASDAAAEGATQKGVPFPEKVGGIRFGSTQAQFSDACFKVSGARAADVPGSTRAATLVCSQVIEQPASLPTSATLAVEFCKAGDLCEARLVWRQVDMEVYSEILAALRLKYGNEGAMPDSTPLSTLGASCESETKAHHSVVWIFGETTSKPGVRSISSVAQFHAFCGRDKSVTVHVIYENKPGFLQRRASADANF